MTKVRQAEGRVGMEWIKKPLVLVSQLIGSLIFSLSFHSRLLLLQMKARALVEERAMRIVWSVVVDYQ